jgi:hypothetical protein
MANTGERQPLLDQKIDPRTDITAEGKARDELLDRHTTCVILFFFFQRGSVQASGLTADGNSAVHWV